MEGLQVCYIRPSRYMNTGMNIGFNFLNSTRVHSIFLNLGHKEEKITGYFPPFIWLCIFAVWRRIGVVEVMDLEPSSANRFFFPSMRVDNEHALIVYKYIRRRYDSQMFFSVFTQLHEIHYNTLLPLLFPPTYVESCFCSRRKKMWIEFRSR